MRDDLIEIEIGAIGKIRNGYSFKSKDYVDQGLRIIRIANVQSGEIIDRDPKFYPESKISEFKDYLIEEDDFLISLTGNVGRVGRIDKSLLPALLNQRVGKLELRTKRIEKNYLYHFLTSRSFVNKVIQSSKGVAQLNTSSKKIEAIKIPVLPLPEQRAIVSKIEELFSSLDKGIADLEKAQEQLKVYRQAVLKKAFDLNSKKYKIEEISKEIFAGGDKPKDYFSKVKTDDLKIPIFANAVANRGLYGYTKTARVNEKAITIAGRGSGTGHVELRNEPFVPIVRLITIIPNLQIVVIEFLFYFLKNLNIKKSGSAIPQLTIPMVKEYEIHLPSIAEQQQIVQEIENRLSVCDAVEKNIEESLEKAKSLRQSILKKAFEGTLLTEEEIAECKSAPDYEPASVLLEKIKKEKEMK